MTPAMLARARAGADAMGLQNVELHESLIESLPLGDESVDVVISNGVIDLVHMVAGKRGSRFGRRSHDGTWRQTHHAAGLCNGRRVRHWEVQWEAQ